MNNNRRDNSPLTDEELEPLELRMAELQNLFMNDEIALDELIARTTKYYQEFPWIIIEMELPAKKIVLAVGEIHQVIVAIGLQKHK